MKQPIYQYIIAVILGIIIAFLPDIKPVPVFLSIIYFVTSLLFAFLWPALSWRWGLWISGAMVFLLGLSGIFSGFFDMFLKNDLPILGAGLISACVGSWVGAWVKRKMKTA